MPKKEIINGHDEAWESYIATDNYKAALKECTKKGVSETCFKEAVELAFNAGWSLLITTFLTNLIENEKKWFKQKKVTAPVIKKE